MRRRLLLTLTLSLLLAGGLAWWSSSGSKPLAVEQPERPAPEFVPVEVLARGSQEGLSLSGVVRDPSGEVIAGATISLASSSQQSLTTRRCGVCDELLLSDHSWETTRSVASLLEGHKGLLNAALSTTSDAQGRFRFEHLQGTSFTVWGLAPGHAEGVKERAAPGDPVELFLPAPRRLSGVLEDENGRPLAGLVRAISRRLAHAVEAKAGADGAFTLEGLGEGPFYVLATAPARLPTSRDQVAAGPDPLVLRLATPRRLEVRLLSQGKPVDGAVILHGNHLARELRAKEGLAAVDALYPQELMVWGVAGELASSPVRVSLTKELTALTVNLDKAARLTVSVLDEAGQPVPEPRLELVTRAGDVVASKKLKTGELGQFGPLGTGDYQLRADAELFVQSILPVALKGGEASLEVTLARGVMISGKVIDEYGRPAPGVSVLVTPTGDSVTADADGKFKASVPSPGLYKLEAHHSDWGGGELKVTAPKSDVELQLEPKAGAEITVTVDGRRVEGAHVVLFHTRGNFRSDRPSGADGVVLMRGLPPDAYTLVASHPDFLSSERQTVTLVDGQLLKVPAALKPGASIVGQVVDTLGAPVTGVLVMVTPRGAEAAPTDAQGNFHLQPLRPKATYSLHVSQRGFDQPDRVLGVAGGDPVRLVVKRQSTYRGRVVGEGAPLKSFRVDEFEVNSVDGAFELPLPSTEDRVVVTIEAPGFEPLMEKRPNTPDLGVFELKRAPLVTGLVRDEGGAPVADAVVSCDSCEQSVLTGADGHFSLGKPAFQHEFKVVAKKGRRTATRNATDRSLDGLELVLAPGVPISGTAYLADGTPAAGVEIGGVQVDRSEPVSVVTNADGTYSTEIPAGTYRFALQVPGASPHSADPPALIIQLDGSQTHLDFGPVPGLATLTAHLTPQPGYALWLVKGQGSTFGNPPMELLHAPWAMMVYQPRVDRVTFGGLTPGRYTLIWASFHGNVAEGPLVVPVDVPGSGEVTLVR